MRQGTAKLFGSVALLLALAGCQNTYYDAMEKIGYPKRDILVDNIEDTQVAQEEVQQQFTSALEQFRSVITFNGDNLEELYKKLDSEYRGSVKAADKVRSRIRSVKNVSEALFTEWEEELELYSDASLRRSSARKLKDTRRQYTRMVASLEKAEVRMQPVLDVFQDQTLFLKHNLNAVAVSSLKGEFNSVKADIDRLIKEMQTSIAESRRFVEQLNRES